MDESRPRRSGQEATLGISVLCVGNGGLVVRNGRALTHSTMAEFLVDLSERVKGVCFCNWCEPVDDPLARTDLTGVDRVRVVALDPIRGNPAKKLLAAMAALWRVAREISRSEFVYLYWPGALTELVAQICRLSGKPFGLYMRGGDARDLLRIAPMLSHARFALAAGNALRDLARAYCKDVDAVMPMTPIRAIHLRSPLPLRRSRTMQLLYVGRLEPIKGIRELIHACELLNASGCATELTLIGHCDESADLLNTIAPALAGTVRVLEAIPEFHALSEYYRAADVFVLPSHSEGFPRVLYEAMAFGLPIVTTFVGGISAIMIDGNNCLRVEVASANDLADKLKSLFSDGELRKRIAWGGYDTIVKLMADWKGSHAIQVAEKLGKYATGT